MAIQTTTHTDVLRLNASRPEAVISVQDPIIEMGGDLWTDALQPTRAEDIPLLALTSASGWARTTWRKPASILGVQFCGDNNDGWARILVDGETVWSGNTYGGEHKFTEYIEISGLPATAHTVRVEPTGQAGVAGGNIHVTLTAFGWGAVSAENKKEDQNTIFMPFVAQ